MNGRDKCELLNQIRQKIALKNNIEFDFDECTFEGECSGTCPKCESELEYLEMELKKKQYKGEKIELEGIFTLKETEPTEVESKVLFETFGCPDVPSFFDYYIATYFYNYEDNKKFRKLDTYDYEDNIDSEEEKIIVYELPDDEDDS